MPRRSSSTCLMVAIFLLDGGSVYAQLGNEDLPVLDRAFVASKIYSSIQTYFAHRAGIADLDLDATYKAYLDRALGAKDRREFDLATLEFVAKLRNKHTQFDDQWLRQKFGQPLGFGALPMEGKWVVTRADVPGLRRGDIISTVDGIDVERFVREKQRYINASSERSARSLVFDRSYLFPVRFTLGLEDGREAMIERKEPADSPAPDGRPPASEGRWLIDGSSGYIKINGFNDPNYETTAIELVKRFHSARAKCVVIDVRGNGGGSTPYELIRELMDREWRTSSTSTPSNVALYSARGEPPRQLRIESEKQMPREGAFGGRVILLIDRFTCSACEDFVMPFKDNGRATLVGDTT